MLFISSGMQKSGSGYLYNLLNDLVIADGKSDAREIKTRYNLDNLMQQHNNNIGPMTFRNLLKLWRISIKEKPFVVKTHSQPSSASKITSALGMIKIIYCYRDPRDVLLSTIDHGKKSLQEGVDDTFSKMIDFDVALRNVHGWTQVWSQYNEMGHALMIKYEDLMSTPLDSLQQIQNFLALSVSPEICKEILWKYSTKNKSADMTGMHFNKAVTARYETEMSEEQKQACQNLLGNKLVLMGYTV